MNIHSVQNKNGEWKCLGKPCYKQKLRLKLTQLAYLYNHKKALELPEE